MQRVLTCVMRQTPLCARAAAALVRTVAHVGGARLSAVSASELHFARTCHVCGAGEYQVGFSFLARNAALANFKQPWGRRRVLRARPVSIERQRCIDAGAIGVHACAPGLHQANQGNACAPCAAGRFGGVVGGTACTACSIGQYADAVGSVVCKKCPLNAYGLGAAAKVSFEAECGLCPSGTALDSDKRLIGVLLCRCSR